MRVFTIAPSRPFLRTMIEALIDGALIDGFDARDDLERLARVSIYLPTQRACRLARDAFLDVVRGNAVILPRIVALGDVDEDELIFAGAANADLSLSIEPALGGMERRIILARLVMQWTAQSDIRQPGASPLVVAGPAAALRLADDLARLMDDMTTRGVAWNALDTLVPDDYDKYWQLTLAFLKIARDMWPRILAECGSISPAERRDRLIAAETALLRRRPGPVIAAGSTGSMPATADLLAAIAAHPEGAVVLPGLDTLLDEESWTLIAGAESDGREPAASPAPGHPQFAMRALLARMGLSRRDVARLGDQTPAPRDRLMSEAMRPAAATDRWNDRLGQDDTRAAIDAAMNNLTVIAAANAEEEALAVAVALREAAEQDRTAALVTPDRDLARRVMAGLARWKLSYDDSGGDALAQTSAGIFARLTAEAALEGCAPLALMALVKHPLFRLGRSENGFDDAIAALELGVLRGPRLMPGIARAEGALAAFRAELEKFARGETSTIRRNDPRARIVTEQIDAASDLLARLAAALEPLIRRADAGAASIAAFAAAHHAAIETLTRDENGRVAAFEGHDGAALAGAFAELIVAAPAAPFDVARATYGETFDAVIAGRIVRRPGAPGARLRIYGPLEARLMTCDRVIAAGLVETVWPPDPRTDPWLNRAMRLRLGLDLPERRIGLSAHDLVQTLGGGEAILSYAARRGGEPAVASRFLHRLKAIGGEAAWQQALSRGQRYLDWARALDRPERLEAIARPEPRPPRRARPAKLSVTEVETLLRDPYSIYARHVLGLMPLDAIDAPLGASERGSLIHDALAAYTQAMAQNSSVASLDERLAELLAIGEKKFSALLDHGEARALWWARFVRIADWFVNEWEAPRLAVVDTVHAEKSGRMTFPVAGRDFVLTARADRIERHRDGTFFLLDFKTGTVPTSKQVRMGLSPQLTLEAAILRAGGFAGIAAGASVKELGYVRLSGNEPAGEERTVSLNEKGGNRVTPDEAADTARAELEKIVRDFDTDTMPYRSLVLPMWRGRYGKYDHLARVKEWMESGYGNGGGGGE